ncbi:MAG: SGNH/GDSL hydrolase family protein [Ruminococcaceae bacterium]|nr:SGNH/GDSL hydrolase family protein [Oscillospiraceae bacterium]
MNVTSLFNENELPLESLVTDGGFVGIFRTIACVGDSLSSGEFESIDDDGKKHYHDLYDYSWGQYIARMAGCKVYNFSKGGMTAKQYIESFAEQRGFWDKELASQAYIIALGVNDLFNQHMPLGSAEDICLEDYTKNAPTFCGYYAAIIQRYKEIQPDAKFFFMTMPSSANEAQNKITEELLALLNKLTEIFSNSYVIDLYNYAPVYDAYFREKFFLGGHMNACGYILTAKMVASYIDYIIRHNMDDFKQIGFVGTPYKYR